MARPVNPGKSNTFKEEPAKAPANAAPENFALSDQTVPPTAKEKKKTARNKKEPKQPTAKELARRDQKFRVLGLFYLLLSFYLLFSFTGYLLTWQSDFSFADTLFKHFSFRHLIDQEIPSENWMGKIGALTGYLFITKWFGISSYLFVLVIFNAGLSHFFHIRFLPLWKTAAFALLGVLWTPLILNLTLPGSDLLSGVYGFQVNIWLIDFLGISGLVMFLAFTGLSFLILAFNIPFRWFEQKSEAIPVPGYNSEETKSPDFSGDGISEVAEADPVAYPDTGNYLKPETELPQELDLEISPSVHTEHRENPEIELLIEKPVEPPVEKGSSEKNVRGVDTLYDPTLDLSGYRFPGLELLNDYGSDPVNVRKEELEANKDKIVQTLSNYDIKISKIKATIGPAVTLYEIVPEAGVRISRIKNLEDDIALSLAAMGIRIIAPIPGKGTIGIEVPNQSPEIVSIKSLLGTDKFKNSTYELPFVLGKTIANETFIADLARMPHLLMAGATGQGKSVGLNTIITSLLYKKHPAQIKFVLIDPKKVELTLYTKLERHFLAKLPDADEAIITDTKKVIRTLNSLNIEMDSRYDLLRDAQVRNIKEYNEKFFSRKLNPLDGHQFLPYIVIVIDEFADLIMTAGREIETPLARLAQLARATGIHLIIATQRPSVNIITGTIKANFPARIAFRVISKIDSRTILDSSGADQLIGRGDMLLSTGSDLIRLQCAFVDTPEIDKVTDFIGSQRGYPEAFALPEFYDEESTPSKDFDTNEKDEFFTEAARLVVQHQHGSTSLIQRKLKLGYNRAGRIIDQLESAGIVGPFEGSKAREVNYKDLNSLEEHLNLLGK
jgi:S-DNA-T family DNA segregation ATPase FtsK/SpoIIIE